MANELPDRELIIQLQAGDLQALGALYDRHRPMVYRTAHAITGDPDAAADLLQDVFLRLFRFAGHFQLDLPLEPWLYRMTANAAYTWLKRQKRWFGPLEDLSEWLIGVKKDAPIQALDKNTFDEAAQLQQALRSLSPAHRVVVGLYYVNDLSVQEIADILEVPVGTVKSRLHYSRQFLKYSIEKATAVSTEIAYEFT